MHGQLRGGLPSTCGIRGIRFGSHLTLQVANEVTDFCGAGQKRIPQLRQVGVLLQQFPFGRRAIQKNIYPFHREPTSPEVVQKPLWLPCPNHQKRWQQVNLAAAQACHGSSWAESS